MLESVEAVEFLCRRGRQADQEGAAALAEELGRLPLALEQAAAYVVQTGRTLSNYRDLFRQRQSELLRRGKLSTAYPDTVATTWEVSFQEVEKLSPAGADLLRLFAFLAPDDIRQAMLREGADLLPEPLASIVQDDLDYDEAALALRRYSLVEGSTDALSVHRLVQAVVRDRLEEEARKKWSAVAVHLVNQAFPDNSSDFRNWSACATLLPHAIMVSGYAEELNTSLEECSRLLNQVGLYLMGRAQYPDAKAFHERALSISEAAYGPEHPAVATRLNNLGNVLQALGDLPAAQVHFRRALRIDEAIDGPAHPHVARDLSNLGTVLQDLGELSAARAHLERALRIDEAAYGPEHPNVARDLSNLGNVLQLLGELSAAGIHLERALRIDERVHGPEHPNVAADLNNLGTVLQALGDAPAAQVHFQRALEIFRRSLGDDHPHTMIARRNLETPDS